MTPYQVEEWLRTEGGYEHHCFISWPHTIDSDITECARQVTRAITGRLAQLFAEPRVFLDETALQVGDTWEPRLKSALCKSMAMVAVCAPIYYHPKHKWCGLEWAAMDVLSNNRFPGQSSKAIFSLMIRMSEPLPPVISATQYIDISRVTILGRQYYKRTEFRETIAKIGNLIEKIAFELVDKQIKADCDSFQFPTESAFSDYGAPLQGPPLVS
jgi:hypothetical protein